MIAEEGVEFIAKKGGKRLGAIAVGFLIPGAGVAIVTALTLHELYELYNLIKPIKPYHRHYIHTYLCNYIQITSTGRQKIRSMAF